MGELIGFTAAGQAPRTAPDPRPSPRPTPAPSRTAPERLWREAVGEQLRHERRRTGRRLVDVAADAGISPQYLSEIERGLKDPSSELLAAVVGALGLTVVDLATRVVATLSSAPDRAPRRLDLSTSLTAPTRLGASPLCLAA